MDNTLVEKDRLHRPFIHDHPLSLVHLYRDNKYENSDKEDEDEHEDEEEFVEEGHHGGQCDMCKERIWSFHLCYYNCKSCDYSLHKFCAELPRTHENHPLDPGHRLEFRPPSSYERKCFVCNLEFKDVAFYYCEVCNEYMDIICATVSEHKVSHPSHPHQLVQMFGPIVSNCRACGGKHEGVFFQCITCHMFRISVDCALLPTKLLIQKHTYATFTHSHPLTLAYSFPYLDRKARYFPLCRVCAKGFHSNSHLWIYKCDKCRYYVHVGCATSKTPGSGKTFKNFKEDEHSNLLHCPFDDEGDNLLKRHMCNQKEFVGKQHDGEMLNHSSHQHPLILFDKQTSVDKKSISLHDPMKRTQLLCDGCVKPIMTVPFYKCSRYVDEQCCFVLHEWCTKLPTEVKDYVGHREHSLFLLPKVPSKFFGVFECDICRLQSNGFAYGCAKCEYYVDINCAFIPEEITHDAHPNHLLYKVNYLSHDLSNRFCKACRWSIRGWGFHCPTCDFYFHVGCVLLLPRVIKHKCDKHPLSLRYEPAENHITEYFCEICEDEFNPWVWFYHCTTCAQSMHTDCAPLILQCEQATHVTYHETVYRFLNVKFGGTIKIKGHPHRLTFVQGLESDGRCIRCRWLLQYKMIFKCLECDFALDYECASILHLSIDSV
ncbi:hypothetical protein SSX86_021305 [Deinandra increscens subsp. villosa]|uniref:Phorbol-ester/DAG-type domain-containing protein n=1 Tax=Deinandra increscens subsp. villosa TaxID=3103831 RepID=A0AAP0GU73_9ASTR